MLIGGDGGEADEVVLMLYKYQTASMLDSLSHGDSKCARLELKGLMFFTCHDA